MGPREAVARTDEMVDFDTRLPPHRRAQEAELGRG